MNDDVVVKTVEENGHEFLISSAPGFVWNSSTAKMNRDDWCLRLQTVKKFQ